MLSSLPHTDQLVLFKTRLEQISLSVIIPPLMTEEVCKWNNHDTKVYLDSKVANNNIPYVGCIVPLVYCMLTIQTRSLSFRCSYVTTVPERTSEDKDT